MSLVGFKRLGGGSGGLTPTQEAGHVTRMIGDSSAELVDAWNVATVSDEVIVCQLRSGSMFCVPVSLNQLFTHAEVDTAAEVSLISDALYRRLEPRPRFKKGDLEYCW